MGNLAPGSKAGSSAAGSLNSSERRARRTGRRLPKLTGPNGGGNINNTSSNLATSSSGQTSSSQAKNQRLKRKPEQASQPTEAPAAEKAQLETSVRGPASATSPNGIEERTSPVSSVSSSLASVMRPTNSPPSGLDQTKVDLAAVRSVPLVNGRKLASTEEPNLLAQSRTPEEGPSSTTNGANVNDLSSIDQQLANDSTTNTTTTTTNNNNNNNNCNATSKQTKASSLASLVLRGSQSLFRAAVVAVPSRGETVRSPTGTSGDRASQLSRSTTEFAFAGRASASPNANSPSPEQRIPALARASPELEMAMQPPLSRGRLYLQTIHQYDDQRQRVRQWIESQPFMERHWSSKGQAELSQASIDEVSASSASPEASTPPSSGSSSSSVRSRSLDSRARLLAAGLSGELELAAKDSVGSLTSKTLDNEQPPNKSASCPQNEAPGGAHGRSSSACSSCAPLRPSQPEAMTLGGACSLCKQLEATTVAPARASKQPGGLLKRQLGGLASRRLSRAAITRGLSLDGARRVVQSTLRQAAGARQAPGNPRSAFQSTRSLLNKLIVINSNDVSYTIQVSKQPKSAGSQGDVELPGEQSTGGAAGPAGRTFCRSRRSRPKREDNSNSSIADEFNDNDDRDDDEFDRSLALGGLTEEPGDNKSSSRERNSPAIRSTHSSTSGALSGAAIGSYRKFLVKKVSLNRRPQLANKSSSSRTDLETHKVVSHRTPPDGAGPVNRASLGALETGPTWSWRARRRSTNPHLLAHGSLTMPATASAGSRANSERLSPDEADSDRSSRAPGSLGADDALQSCGVASQRLRELALHLEHGAVPPEVLLQTLEYAASVLDSINYETTTRVAPPEDDEDGDLSEVQSDAVPNEVRQWLESTFTRSSVSQRRRSDDKLRFRSVANAIRAGIMVERIWRRMSASVPVNSAEVSGALAKMIDDWSCDCFTINQLSNGQALRSVSFELFQRYGLLYKFKIPSNTLKNFLTQIESGYTKHRNPYHNNLHAADVTQTVHYLLWQSGLTGWLSDLEIFATLFAAIIHDYLHTGTTNNFHVMSSSETALVYNDKSVLENLHISQAFQLMANNQDCNVLANLKRNEYREFRALVIDMVLATDMSSHFQQIKAMKTILGHSNEPNAPFTADKSKVLSLVIHIADISHPAKNWRLHSQWTGLLMEEFFRQGDREKELGLDCSPLCDRETTLVPESQVGFIDFIVSPSLEVCGDVLDRILYQMSEAAASPGLKHTLPVSARASSTLAFDSTDKQHSSSLNAGNKRSGETKLAAGKNSSTSTGPETLTSGLRKMIVSSSASIQRRLRGSTSSSAGNISQQPTQKPSPLASAHKQPSSKPAADKPSQIYRHPVIKFDSIQRPKSSIARVRGCNEASSDNLAPKSDDNNNSLDIASDTSNSVAFLDDSLELSLGDDAESRTDRGKPTGLSNKLAANDTMHKALSERGKSLASCLGSCSAPQLKIFKLERPWLICLEKNKSMWQEKAQQEAATREANKQS